MNKTLLFLLLGFALASLNFTYAPFTPVAPTASADDAVMRMFWHITYQPLPNQVRSEDLPGFIDEAKTNPTDTLPPIQDRKRDFITDPNRNPTDQRLSLINT